MICARSALIASDRVWQIYTPLWYPDFRSNLCLGTQRARGYLCRRSGSATFRTTRDAVPDISVLLARVLRSSPCLEGAPSRIHWETGPHQDDRHTTQRLKYVVRCQTWRQSDCMVISKPNRCLRSGDKRGNPKALMMISSARDLENQTVNRGQWNCAHIWSSDVGKE
jgi:hypothetical protein